MLSHDHFKNIYMGLFKPGRNAVKTTWFCPFFLSKPVFLSYISNGESPSVFQHLEQYIHEFYFSYCVSKTRMIRPVFRIFVLGHESNEELGVNDLMKSIVLGYKNGIFHMRRR